MNDEPRRTLRELIERHGPGLCSDARRWSCAAALRLPPRIRIGTSVVMPNFDTQLFPHHVNEQRLYDFSAPVAAVAEHPSSPGLWGLKNLSPQKWVVSTQGGAVKDVGPGRSVTLAVGARIQFGETVGEIKL